MEKKIGGKTYNIIPIPPYLSPYSTRISQLLKAQPQSAEQAAEYSGEIEKLMDKLLSETVSPKPPKEHQLEAFNALVDLTNKIIEDAEFFRKHTGPSDKASRHSSAPSR